MTTAIRYDQEKSKWCWVATSKSIASAESPFYSGVSQEYVVNQIFPGLANNNVSANIGNHKRAASYFSSLELDSNIYTSLYAQHYDEQTVRDFIFDGHAIIAAMTYQTSSGETAGHSISIVGFEWVDLYGISESPGYYIYYYYDPWGLDIVRNSPYSNFNSYDGGVLESNAKWHSTVAYTTSYASDAVPF